MTDPTDRSLTTGRRRSGVVAARLLSLLLFTTGTWHFVRPHGFESIVPRFLGDPTIWVQASGVAELACAAALAVRPTRRAGGLATAVLFVLVFPANVQMALDSGGSDSDILHSPVIAWARLPLQIPLIAWAVYIARAARREAAASGHPAVSP